MSIKSFTRAALIAAAALGSATAFAASDTTLLNGRSVFGAPATAEGSGTRVVDVNSARSANVNCGDVVTFRNGEQRFTWKFDVVGHRTVDLQKIAPAGFTSKPLLVHVAPSEGERRS